MNRRRGMMARFGAVAVAGLTPGLGAGGLVFTEEAAQRGLDYSYAISGGAAGWGLAFGDLDGDGDPDLVAIGQTDGAVGLWENDGTGHFIDRAPESGIPNLGSTSSLLLFDPDRDGDLDIVVGRFVASLRLLRNDGEFNFTDVTTQVMPNESGPVTGLVADDVNGDGRVDLYLSRYGTDNRVLVATGDQFVYAPGAFGANDPWNTWQSVFIDANGDGQPDVYTSNDKKVPAETEMHNRLYLLDDGAFTNASASSGADVNAYSMGLAAGDVNGDGIEDLYCANLQTEASPLLLGNGDGTFSDVTAEYGVGNWRTAWAAIVADFDNDARPDLFVCNFGTPNRLYLGGPPPWSDVGPDAGVDVGTGLSHCAAMADIDADGDLDLVLQNNGDSLRLLVNQTNDARSWTRLRVPGLDGVAEAIGTTVAARTGATWQHRVIRAGGNTYKSHNDQTVHIGLGAAETIDELVVTWRGGVTRTLAGAPARTRWTIHPPSELGDQNGNGFVDVTDLAAFLHCAGAPLAPGCERLDVDGDFDLDVQDLAILIDGCAEPVPDCDGDGVPDPLQILVDPRLDPDGDAAVDGCGIGPDLTGDGLVDGADLGVLLAQWGSAGSADLDGSGSVDGADLGLLLAAWD